MKQPKFKTAPPLTSDAASLKDFSSINQQNLNQLFSSSHDHTVFTTAPTSNQGDIMDVILVQLGSSYYLYAKFPVVGWKRTLLS